MLAYIRTFAKSPFATVLFGLLLISFAVFGISDVFRNRSIKDSVVQAGPRSISGQEFKLRFDEMRKQLERENGGQPITTEQAAANGLERNLANSLAGSESLAAMLAKYGVVPSDTLVVEQIRKQPAFFDQITGKFDKATYQGRLAEVGLTEQLYERQLADEISQTHMDSGLAAGLTVPRTYMAMIAAYTREARDFGWFLVSPGVAGPPTPPTDAQLTTYVSQNPQRFTKPELRQLTFVRFSSAALAPTIKVDEAEVLKRFNFEKDTLSIPETRSIIQVPVRDAAAGARALDMLKKGQPADAVAKAVGANPIVYQNAPKSAISDRKIGDAAYVASLKAGDVIGPVQGALGLSVIKVEKISPGHQATLDEARAKIEAEVRKDGATDQIYKTVQSYDDARSGGATMVEAAKKANVAVIPYPVAVTAQGQTLQGQQTDIPAKILQSAFALPESGESEVVDLGEGEYAAVRVDKVFASGLAKLDEVRPAATQLFILTELDKKLKAKADELIARIKKGEPMDKVAASVGAQVQTASEIRRDTASQAYSQDLIAKVFSAKTGDVVSGQDVRLGVVVAKVGKVSTGPMPELAMLIEQQRPGFRSVIFNDIGQAARTAVRDAMKPKVDYDRARTAIGLEAAAKETTPKEAKK